MRLHLAAIKYYVWLKFVVKRCLLNVKSMGAQGEVIGMFKFEEIQQLTQQLHVNGGAKDVNDSSSDKENDEDKDSSKPFRQFDL